MSRATAPTVIERAAQADALIARYADLIADPSQLRETLLQPLPVVLWANPLRLDRQSLRMLLLEDGFAAEPLPWHPLALRLPPGSRPGRHWTFLAGLNRIQEEVSMVPVSLLDPQPGERILDLCAAPGSKTAQIAVAMDDTGTLVANDSKRGRVAGLRQMIKRLGLVNCSVTVRDGQGMDSRAGTFDRILVDAPCSCEGTFRKITRPEMVTDEVRRRAALVQRRLLRRAVALTRPGGRIVYSTCTFAPEENEAVVDAILREHGDNLHLRPAALPGLVASPGIRHWLGRRFPPEMHHCARIWPHQQDTGGFFVAVLEKAAGPRSEDGACFNHAEEPRDWLRPLTDRFAIPVSAFDGVRLIRRGNRHVHALTPDHQAPSAPAPEMLGLPLIRRKSLPLKPTSSAVLRWGMQAQQNWLELDADQRDSFLRRQTVVVRTGQLARCTGPGYAVARHRDHVLGLGQLVYDRESPTVRLLSLVPKAWARDAGESAENLAD